MAAPSPYRIEGAIQDCAVIRTTFQTIELFPPNDPIRADMYETVADARGNLIRFFSGLCDAIRSDGGLRGLDGEKFKKRMLETMTHGCATRDLNGMMKLKVFDERKPLYHYAAAGLGDAASAAGLPADVFVQRVFDDLLASVRDAANYSDAETFNRTIDRKYIVVIYSSISDGFFWGNGL